MIMWQQRTSTVTTAQRDRAALIYSATRTWRHLAAQDAQLMGVTMSSWRLKRGVFVMWSVPAIEVRHFPVLENTRKYEYSTYIYRRTCCTYM